MERTKKRYRRRQAVFKKLIKTRSNGNKETNLAKKTERRNGLTVNTEEIESKEIYMWKIGTWNVRSLQGKEHELEEEFEKIELEVLAITETKKKGQGMIKTEKGHVLIFSGVPKHKRAAMGVACLIHAKAAEQVYNWKGWTERILSVELRNKNKDIKTVIIVYGPNEDDTAENKNKFWEDLTTITEGAKGKIFILGDFNSRVGKKDITYNTILGKHGENIRNNNGVRMLDFCILHNLIVSNTFFEHKNIHKYTREVKSRNEKSIIDYILVEKEFGRNVIDTKVRRGPEIGSDHYLLVSIIKEKTIKSKSKEEMPKKTMEYESIKTYKLQNKTNAEIYKNTLEKKFESTVEYIDLNNLEILWNYFKNTILQIATKICGSSKKINYRKQTSWWTNDIKRQIKIKKKSWTTYLSNRTTNNYEQYKNERKRVKQLVSEAKKKQWIEFGEKMETDSKGNQKLFYKTLKSLRKEKTPDVTNIKNKNGEMLTEDDEVMNRWREYFQDLLEGQQHIEEEIIYDNTIPEEGEIEYITLQEVQEVIKELKNGKAPGKDRLTTEMFKNLGEKGLVILAKIYNKTWAKEQIPNDWKKSIIVPIFKKGDKYDCNNYRGITLISTAMKIYEQIIDRKIKPIVENTLEESQSGFRKGRSIQDHLFTVKLITERRLKQGKKLYLGFVDLERAFDRVQRTKLWDILETRGISNKIIRVIKNMYESNVNCVVRNSKVSGGFISKQGLRQGGGLSPVLFNIFIDEIIKACSPKVKKLHVGFRCLRSTEISEGAFADDLVIMTENEKDLQRNLEIWNTTLEEYGMRINKNKTKVMVIGNEKKVMNIQIDGVAIEQVETVKYLGVEIQENGKQEIEINNRVEKTLKLFFAMQNVFINKKEISKKTKINIFKTIYRPILTFGCESWVLSQRQKSKIQAIEMKYLRRVREVTKRDKLRNTKIRDDLQIQSTLNFIENRQLSWWGHLQRMSNTRPVKQVWQSKAQKGKQRGRPRQTWDGAVGEILKKRGKTYEEARLLSGNKKEWAKFVHGQ